jgi:kynurenine formamidase
MCDRGCARGKGWQGWRALPDAAHERAPQGGGAAGRWVDLSHPLDAGTPRLPLFPAPRFERIRSLPEHPLNLTRMEMVVHVGTHVDSPRHFFDDGPAFEEIPVARLSGPGLVWPVPLAPGQDVGPEHLLGAERWLRPGDILILDTGSHRAVGTPAYDDHPALSVAAARWIVDHEIKLLGVDTPTPDAPVKRRTEDFDYPVHRLLLAHGVLIAEQLTNLASLSGRRVEVVCSALNIAGSDGAPARILARTVGDHG